MTNKEFISELAKRTGLNKVKTEKQLQDVCSVILEQLQEGNSVSFQGFGALEVKKKPERISIHPVTKLRMLSPPKLVLTFKPSTILKDKFKNR